MFNFGKVLFISLATAVSIEGVVLTMIKKPKVVVQVSPPPSNTAQPTTIATADTNKSAEINSEAVKGVSTPTDQSASKPSDKPSSGSSMAIPSQTAPQTTSGLILSLIRIGQVGNAVQFRAYVSGATNGSCLVSYVNKNGQQISQVGKISNESNGLVDCTDTDIPAANFPTSGLWTANLTASDQGRTSVSLVEQVNVIK